MSKICRLCSLVEYQLINCVNNRRGDIYKEAMQSMHICKQFGCTAGRSELLRIAVCGERVESTLFRVNLYVGKCTWLEVKPEYKI